MNEIEQLKKQIDELKSTVDSLKAGETKIITMSSRIQTKKEERYLTSILESGLQRKGTR